MRIAREYLKKYIDKIDKIAIEKYPLKMACLIYHFMKEDRQKSIFLRSPLLSLSYLKHLLLNDYEWDTDKYLEFLIILKDFTKFVIFP